MKNKLNGFVKAIKKIDSDYQILDFIYNIEYYQSNHNGYYNRNNLANSYNKLPNDFKLLIKPNTVNNLYRGVDGIDNKPAVSFTNNKDYATTFGTYTIPFSEIVNFDGLIDTSKLVKFLNKNKINHNIGDDEGEVIVLNPTYKNTLINNIEKYRNNRYLNECDNNINDVNYYNKFPLSSLVKQAKKFQNFKEFSNFYCIDIYHGYYWHLTDNPNFQISNTIGPRDMSSMSNGSISENGAIMLTSDLNYWDEHYNTSKDSWKRDVKRNYVVLFDVSDIEPGLLKQVGRGFGNEVYIDSNTAKKLKQIGVYSLKYAKILDNKFHNIIPQSENSLLDLWNYANSYTIKESAIFNNIKNSTLNENNDNLTILYHGSPNKFYKFNNSNISNSINRQFEGWGIYLTNDIDAAKKYGNYIYQVSLQNNNNDDLTFIDISKPINKNLFIKIITSFYEYKNEPFNINDFNSYYNFKELENILWNNLLNINNDLAFYGLDSVIDIKNKNQWFYISNFIKNNENLKTLYNQYISSQKPNFKDYGFMVNNIGLYTYDRLSHLLGGNRNASQFLFNIGISGLKRTISNARIDYVVFDSNIIKIENITVIN